LQTLERGDCPPDRRFEHDGVIGRALCFSPHLCGEPDRSLQRVERQHKGSAPLREMTAGHLAAI
jgi:hypothetical protein